MPVLARKWPHPPSGSSGGLLSSGGIASLDLAGVLLLLIMITTDMERE